MKFGTYKTHYEITRDSLKQSNIKDFSPVKYVQHSIEYKKTLIVRDKSIEIDFIYAELKWLEYGKPYYNIHENIIESTLRMKLDNIPSNFLDIPCEYPSIVLCFPENYNISSFLVWKADCDRAQLNFSVKFKNALKGFFFSFICNENSIEHNINILLDKDHLLGEKCRNTSKEDLRKYCQNVMRFYSIVKFLSNMPNEELIQYDILSKYKDVYQTASPKRRKEIEDKSKRRGKIGWNVGVNSLVKLNADQNSGQDTGNNSHYELSNAHIRTGHIHCVRCGPQKKHVKVMWFRPTVVRPDLPFKVS